MNPEADGAAAEAGGHPQPPVRIISTLDRLGLRYLLADGQLLAGAGCWALPLAVGERDALGEREPFGDAQGLAFRLARAAAADDRLPGLWVKTGQLLAPAAVDRVAEYLQERRHARYLLDPELCDRRGRARVPSRTATAFLEKLLPRAAVAVVNGAEAELLTGRSAESPSAMREAARALTDLGAAAAIVTGGHLDGHACDWLYDGRGFEELGADRIAIDGSVHGAGGIYSSALAAGLALGSSLLEAAHGAKRAVTAALDGRWWVTAAGLWAAQALDPEDRPPGYWVANPIRAGLSLRALDADA